MKDKASTIATMLVATSGCPWDQIRAKQYARATLALQSRVRRRGNAGLVEPPKKNIWRRLVLKKNKAVSLGRRSKGANRRVVHSSQKCQDHLLIRSVKAIFDVKIRNEYCLVLLERN